jgi:anti-sigma regulatory factor (Ser/Thr protein kinase)
VDFFVSYASVDRPWAEWIAWQLEADGYQVVVQAWDFAAGSDWAHEMQNAMLTAERVVAVLSPDYLNSAHGEAEWREFYAQDPSGERRQLLPVRVREVDPPGLLKTRVYVDLVGLNSVAAREALLAAARGVRGKPHDEPEFPGFRERPEVDGRKAPRFPAALPAVDSISSEPLGESVILRAGDSAAIGDFIVRASASLRRHEFADSDIGAFRISLLELVHNAVNYVGEDEAVELKLDDFDEQLSLEVTDRGKGFDLEASLARSEVELSERGFEHGLLRAYRLGSGLEQVSTAPHVMRWVRLQTPQKVPTTFGENVIPLVFSYKLSAIRIWQTVHTIWQFQYYTRRSPAFMDLIFDPLQRPARKYVGIEIVGEYWSGSAFYSRPMLDSLLAFKKRNPEFDKQLLLFADTDSFEHRELRKYCRRAGIVMFEDKSVIRHLRDKDVSRAIRKAQEKGARP